MNTFFTELSKSMTDGQEVNLKITKTGSDLTILSTSKEKKDLIASGTPEDMDTELLEAIIATPEKKKGLKTSVLDDETEEKEEEAAPPAGSEKGRAIAKSKKEAEKAAKKGTPKAEKTAKKKDEVIAEEPGEQPYQEEEQEQKEQTEAPANTEAEFKELMKQGKELFTAREYEKAMEAFGKAKELKPNDPQAISEHANAEKWVKAVANLDL